MTAVRQPRADGSPAPSIPRAGSPIDRPRVLFLCTGNSCRSQMAEGWVRHLHAPGIEAVSAGTHPKGVDPLAVRVMAEAGVDISRHISKLVDPVWFADGYTRVDLVVTLCDAAATACPVPPRGIPVHHAPFDDPPALAAACTSDEGHDGRLAHYCRVRDEIRGFVAELPGLLQRKRSP